MLKKNIPLFYYYSWESVPDIMIPNILAEFKANAAEDLVFSHVWAKRILREPTFFPPLMTMVRKAGIRLGAVHAPWGAAFDLNCSDMARRKGMIADHKTAMAYAADVGCRTYTIHVGAYSWVMERIPLERLRKLAVETLEELLPEAERLGLVIAMENSYEPPNGATEVVGLISKFASPNLGCCFDTGHACLMSPFPGKVREKYFYGIDQAWGDELRETADSFKLLKPYIVTAHLHDNDGYSDAHLLPGRGRINWEQQIRDLRECPRLLSLQTEVRTIPSALPVKTIVETFRAIMD